MTRLLAILALLPAALLLSTAAQAERITVSSGVGDSLMDACFQSSSGRFVSTNKGGYSGCCSKALGYCILCSTSRTGKCYKFSHMISSNEFLKDLAPDGSVVVDDKPVRPSRRIRKTAPSSNKIIE